MLRRRPRAQRLLSPTIGSSRMVPYLAAIALLAGLLLPCGCASAQTPVRRPAGPFEPPQSGYREVHVPDVPLPDPAGGLPVSLDAILAYADRHAPALHVARERLGLGDAAVAG